jgi:hypothetical protein
MSYFVCVGWVEILTRFQFQFSDTHVAGWCVWESLHRTFDWASEGNASQPEADWSRVVERVELREIIKNQIFNRFSLYESSCVNFPYILDRIWTAKATELSSCFAIIPSESHMKTHRRRFFWKNKTHNAQERMNVK